MALRKPCACYWRLTPRAVSVCRPRRAANSHFPPRAGRCDGSQTRDPRAHTLFGTKLAALIGRLSVSMPGPSWTWRGTPAFPKLSKVKTRWGDLPRTSAIDMDGWERTTTSSRCKTYRSGCSGSTRWFVARALSAQDVLWGEGAMRGSASIPIAGDFVEVRTRRWLVEGLISPSCRPSPSQMRTGRRQTPFISSFSAPDRGDLWNSGKPAIANFVDHARECVLRSGWASTPRPIDQNASCIIGVGFARRGQFFERSRRQRAADASGEWSHPQAAHARRPASTCAFCGHLCSRVGKSQVIG